MLTQRVTGAEGGESTPQTDGGHGGSGGMSRPSAGGSFVLHGGRKGAKDGWCARRVSIPTDRRALTAARKCLTKHLPPNVKHHPSPDRTTHRRKPRKRLRKEAGTITGLFKRAAERTRQESDIA